MEFVTLVNRSSKDLEGVWDGRHYTLTPGKHQFPRIQAEKFKEQNIVMGSEDPRSMWKDYLIGIIENGDDVSPVEQTSAIERWDRSKLGGPQTQVIAGRAGLYAEERRTALPADSSFVKP